MSITEHLLRPLLASTPARPLITHYDDAGGTRIELSVATTANWAAKTANWLVEEADVEPADMVTVLLPAHWQTLGVLLGAWWCGAHVVTSNQAEARVAFIGPQDSSTAATAAIVALDPMGMGLPQAPADGAIDFLAEVKLSGDEFRPLFPIPGGSRALNGSTVDEVIAAGRSRAEELGISAKDRVLSTMDWTAPGGLLDGLLAPLAVGAHLVQVTHADPATLDERRRAERTTFDLRL